MLSPTPERWRTLLQRLLDGMHEDGSGCWHWTRAKQSRGYGTIKIDSAHTALTHRLAWELLNGPVPDNLTLDHLCRTRGCCNPDHLEAVPSRVNTLRGVGPTATNARRTRCTHGHLLTPPNVLMRGNRRQCLTCKRDRDRARRTPPDSA